MALSTVLRLFKRLFYVLTGFIAAVFIVWAIMSRSLPDLELWHTIELENESGTRVASAGQVLFVVNRQHQPMMLPRIPVFIRQTPLPRPLKKLTA